MAETATWNASLKRLPVDETEEPLLPSKAVAIWHRLDDAGHMRLVEGYLREAGNFENVRSLDRSPRRVFSDPL